jgi:C-terminal processing protease CtpA/Prc
MRVGNVSLKKSHKILKIFGILIGIIAVLFLVAYFYLNPYRGSVADWTKQNVKLEQILEKKQALDDLDFIKTKVSELHYSARNGLPDAFAKQYAYEKEHLSAKPTLLEVWQAGSRMLHTLNDGHSTLSSYIDERVYTNINYSFENNAVYITIGDKKYKVDKINHMDIQTLMQNAFKQISYENEIYRDYEFLVALEFESNLRWIGSPKFDTYTVEYENDGKTEQVEFQPAVLKQSAANSSKWVSYQIDKEHNVGNFTLNSCTDNDEYKNTLKDFFTAVKKAGVTNVAVDLRSNGGGSSLVANEFIRYLNVDKVNDYTSYYRLKLFNIKAPFTTIDNKKENDLLFKGNVYVLTSPATFSSAMNFSVLLQDNGLAKVIGEPCGNKPTQYGEAVTFLLPNSKLYFSTTFAYFERPNKKTVDADTQVPDYLVQSQDAISKLYEITNTN